MRRIKLNCLVQYLKSEEFYHDILDLEEEGVVEILREYGICDEFTEDELNELSKDLYEMAEKNQFKEIVVLASNVERWNEFENWGVIPGG
jgi:hypothetical protein